MYIGYKIEKLKSAGCRVSVGGTHGGLGAPGSVKFHEYFLNLAYT